MNPDVCKDLCLYTDIADNYEKTTSDINSLSEMSHIVHTDSLAVLFWKQPK